MVPRLDRGQQTPLRVNLKDIPPEGLEMGCEVNPEWLEIPPDEGKVNGVFRWEGYIIKTSDGASVSGTLSGVIVRECVRCLQEFNDQVSIPCIAVFQPVKSDTGRLSTVDQKTKISDSLDQVEEEIYPYEGNQVGLEKMLREQVILNSPIQPLCRLDCLGLCEICGRNLNQGPCRCVDRDEVSPQGTIRFRIVKAKIVD
jgi:uncharacterized protein